MHIFLWIKELKESLINIGSGDEKTIKDFAEFIIKKIGLKINIKFDKTKPNGLTRKVVRISSIAKKYGWKPKVNLEQGFNKVYQSF